MSGLLHKPSIMATVEAVIPSSCSSVATVNT